MITQQMIAQFREEGYVTVDRFVGPETVNGIRAVFDREFGCRTAMPVDVANVTKEMIQGLDPGQMVEMIQKNGKYIEDYIKGRCAMRHLSYFYPHRDLPGLFNPELLERSAEVANKLLEIPPADLAMFAVLLWKPPGGGPTTWHQEDAFDPPERMQCTIGCWISLGEATVENGCMTIIPRSNFGPLRPHPTMGHAKVESDELARSISIPLKAGDALLFNGRMLHGSNPNESGQDRRNVTIVMRSTRLRTPDDHTPRGRLEHTRGSRLADFAAV